MLKYLKIENLTLFFYLAIAWSIFFVLDDFNKVDLAWTLFFLVLHFIQARENFKRDNVQVV